MIKVSTFLRECLNEIEMKKYLPPCERELTFFPPPSSKSLYSLDGTCTTPHASAGTEMFQGTKINKFIYFYFYFILFYFFQKNSIPPGLQHSCRGRRLCCNLGGIEMFQV
jgi:hypothetical protein